jgi:hypothetical protein
MDKKYIDVLNNYTGLSSVITEIARKQDEYILGELNNKIKIVMGLYIEPKRLEKWVKQSMFIETFSVEQLRDFATGKMVRNWLNDKDNEIQELKDQLSLTEKALELACEKLPMEYEYCSSHPERYNLQDEYGCDEPYWVEEGGCEFDDPAKCLECVVNYFKTKAKEMMKSE